MTCSTCRDRLWLVGVPYSSDPDIDADEDTRDWLVACPDCAANLTVSQVAKLAGRDVTVGWSMLDYVAGLLGADAPYVHLGVQPWPFKLRGDFRDHISAWMDHEPDLSEAIRMDGFDMADDVTSDTNRKLT